MTPKQRQKYLTDAVKAGVRLDGQFKAYGDTSRDGITARLALGGFERLTIQDLSQGADMLEIAATNLREQARLLEGKLEGKKIVRTS